MDITFHAIPRNRGKLSHRVKKNTVLPFFKNTYEFFKEREREREKAWENFLNSTIKFYWPKIFISAFKNNWCTWYDRHTFFRWSVYRSNGYIGVFWVAYYESDLIFLKFNKVCTWSSERSYERNLQKINHNWIK